MAPTFSAALAAQQGPLKQALAQLVRIPSVCDESDPCYPFDEPVGRALRAALRNAADQGLRTVCGEGGYCGYAEVGGSELMAGILGHPDVVPAGRREDRAHDPFDPAEKDDGTGTRVLFGRGTQDDMS